MERYMRKDVLTSVFSVYVPMENRYSCVFTTLELALCVYVGRSCVYVGRRGLVIPLATTTSGYVVKELHNDINSGAYEMCHAPWF